MLSARRPGAASSFRRSDGGGNHNISARGGSSSCHDDNSGSSSSHDRSINSPLPDRQTTPLRRGHAADFVNRLYPFPNGGKGNSNTSRNGNTTTPSTTSTTAAVGNGSRSHRSDDGDVRSSPHHHHQHHQQHLYRSGSRGHPKGRSRNSNNDGINGGQQLRRPLVSSGLPKWSDERTGTLSSPRREKKNHHHRSTMNGTSATATVEPHHDRIRTHGNDAEVKDYNDDANVHGLPTSEQTERAQVVTLARLLAGVVLSWREVVLDLSTVRASGRLPPSPSPSSSLPSPSPSTLSSFSSASSQEEEGDVNSRQRTQRRQHRGVGFHHHSNGNDHHDDSSADDYGNEMTARRCRREVDRYSIRRQQQQQPCDPSISLSPRGDGPRILDDQLFFRVPETAGIKDRGNHGVGGGGRGGGDRRIISSSSNSAYQQQQQRQHSRPAHPYSQQQQRQRQGLESGNNSSSGFSFGVGFRDEPSVRRLCPRLQVEGAAAATAPAAAAAFAKPTLSSLARRRRVDVKGFISRNSPARQRTTAAVRPATARMVNNSNGGSGRRANPDKNDFYNDDESSSSSSSSEEAAAAAEERARWRGLLPPVEWISDLDLSTSAIALTAANTRRGGGTHAALHANSSSSLHPSTSSSQPLPPRQLRSIVEAAAVAAEGMRRLHATRGQLTQMRRSGSGNRTGGLAAVASRTHIYGKKNNSMSNSDGHNRVDGNASSTPVISPLSPSLSAVTSTTTTTTTTTATTTTATTATAATAVKVGKSTASPGNSKNTTKIRNGNVSRTANNSSSSSSSKGARDARRQQSLFESLLRLSGAESEARLALIHTYYDTVADMDWALLEQSASSAGRHNASSSINCERTDGHDRWRHHHDDHQDDESLERGAAVGDGILFRVHSPENSSSNNRNDGGGGDEDEEEEEEEEICFTVLDGGSDYNGSSSGRPSDSAGGRGPRKRQPDHSLESAQSVDTFEDEDEEEQQQQRRRQQDGDVHRHISTSQLRQQQQPPRRWRSLESPRKSPPPSSTAGLAATGRRRTPPRSAATATLLSSRSASSSSSASFLSPSATAAAAATGRPHVSPSASPRLPLRRTNNATSAAATAASSHHDGDGSGGYGGDGSNRYSHSHGAWRHDSPSHPTAATRTSAFRHSPSSSLTHQTVRSVTRARAATASSSSSPADSISRLPVVSTAAGAHSNGSVVVGVGDERLSRTPPQFRWRTTTGSRSPTQAPLIVMSPMVTTERSGGGRRDSNSNNRRLVSPMRGGDGMRDTTTTTTPTSIEISPHSSNNPAVTAFPVPSAHDERGKTLGQLRREMQQQQQQYHHHHRHHHHLEDELTSALHPNNASLLSTVRSADVSRSLVLPEQHQQQQQQQHCQRSVSQDAVSLRLNALLVSPPPRGPAARPSRHRGKDNNSGAGGVSEDGDGQLNVHARMDDGADGVVTPEQGRREGGSRLPELSATPPGVLGNNNLQQAGVMSIASYTSIDRRHLELQTPRQQQQSPSVTATAAPAAATATVSESPSGSGSAAVTREVTAEGAAATATEVGPPMAAEAYGSSGGNGDLREMHDEYEQEQQQRRSNGADSHPDSSTIIAESGSGSVSSLQQQQLADEEAAEDDDDDDDDRAQQRLANEHNANHNDEVVVVVESEPQATATATASTTTARDGDGDGDDDDDTGINYDDVEEISSLHDAGGSPARADSLPPPPDSQQQQQGEKGQDMSLSAHAPAPLAQALAVDAADEEKPTASAAGVVVTANEEEESTAAAAEAAPVSRLPRRNSTAISN